jgi:hypothetical protein
MLALIAVILAVLAAFRVPVEAVELGWLAVAFLAAHVLVGMDWAPWRRITDR